MALNNSDMTMHNPLKFLCCSPSIKQRLTHRDNSENQLVKQMLHTHIWQFVWFAFLFTQWSYGFVNLSSEEFFFCDNLINSLLNFVVCVRVHVQINRFIWNIDEIIDKHDNHFEIWLRYGLNCEFSTIYK